MEKNMTDSIFNAQKYIYAILELARVSSSIFGPTNEQIANLDIDVPHYWLKSILEKWASYAERYNRPYFNELSIADKPIRFLRSGQIPPLHLSPQPCCTLCGLSVQPPRRKWHKECIEVFLPYTQRYWKNICRQVKKKCKGICDDCGCKAFELEFDHILAIGLGGESSIENCSAKCKECHRKKTKIDIGKICQSKKANH